MEDPSKFPFSCDKCQRKLATAVAFNRHYHRGCAESEEDEDVAIPKGMHYSTHFKLPHHMPILSLLKKQFFLSE